MRTRNRRRWRCRIRCRGHPCRWRGRCRETAAAAERRSGRRPGSKTRQPARAPCPPALRDRSSDPCGAVPLSPASYPAIRQSGAKTWSAQGESVKFRRRPLIFLASSASRHRSFMSERRPIAEFSRPPAETPAENAPLSISPNAALRAPARNPRHLRKRSAGRRHVSDRPIHMIRHSRRPDPAR